MVSSSNQLGITVAGKDELTPVMKRVEQSVKSVGRTLDDVSTHTGRLDKAFGSLGARLRTGLEMHVLNNALNLVERGIRRLIDVFPDLISRGERWFNTVDSIVDITGMAAAKASELAAVAENVGVSSDGLSRMMNALAKSVKTNGDQFRDYGIRLKDSRGHMLDSYTVFQNIRSRIAEMGPSLQSAALAQMAFGRAALQSADLLTLTNDEWERQAQLARENGLIVGDAANAAVEAWGRAKSVMDQSITGIGTQILGAIAPTLVSLTNGITRVITANMDSIVRFVAGAAVAISNIIGGLFGFEIDAGATFGPAASDPKKSKALRDAIDGMNNANTQAAKTHKASGDAAKRSADDHRRLERAVRDAKLALAEARSDTPFRGNMSDADFILAQQRRSAAVAQARDRLDDARKALREHGKNMREMTKVAAAENRKVRLDMQETYGGGGKKPPIIKGLEQTLKDAKTFGQQIADAIKDAIFGPDASKGTNTSSIFGGLGPSHPGNGQRTGGLVGALQGVQTWLQTMAKALDGLNGAVGGLQPLLSNAGPLVLAILGLKGLPGPGGTPLGPPLPGTKPTTTPGWRDLIPWIGIAMADYGLGDWMSGKKGRELLDRGRSEPEPTPEETRQISLAAWRAIRSRNPFGFDGSTGSVGGGMGNLGGGMGGFGAGGWAGAGGNWLLQSPAALTQEVLGMTSLWTTIRDSLTGSGPLASGLADIQSALIGLAAALNGGGSGGDGKPPASGGSGNSLAGIRVRLKAAETVNRVQGRAISEVRALAHVANTVNVVQAANINKERITNQYQRGAIRDIEKRLDKLDGGHYNPLPVRGSGATVRLVLDAKETRRLFHRGAASGSMKPVN